MQTEVYCILRPPAFIHLLGCCSKCPYHVLEGLRFLLRSDQAGGKPTGESSALSLMFPNPATSHKEHYLNNSSAIQHTQYHTQISWQERWLPSTLPSAVVFARRTPPTRLLIQDPLTPTVLLSPTHFFLTQGVVCHLKAEGPHNVWVERELCRAADLA